MIPTYLSLSAGGYICNTVYYTSLEQMNSKALFIHLPFFSGQVDESKPSLPLEDMIKAIEYVINRIKSIIKI